MTAKIDWYREVLELEPNSKIFFPLARLLAEEGQDEEAIKLLENGLKRHPEYLEARLLRIELLHKRGCKEECNSEIEKLSKMFASYAGFWQAWAACLASEQGQADTASLIRFLAAHFISGPLQLHEVLNRGLDAMAKDGSIGVRPEKAALDHAPETPVAAFSRNQAAMLDDLDATLEEAAAVAQPAAQPEAPEVAEEPIAAEEALPEASEEELLPATEPEEAQAEAFELAAEEAVDEAMAAEEPVAEEEALPEASEEELLPATEPEEAQAEALELAAEEAVDEAIVAEEPVTAEEALPEASEEELLPATEPEEAQAEALELAAEEAVDEAIAAEEQVGTEEALPEATEEELLPATEPEEAQAEAFALAAEEAVDEAIAAEEPSAAAEEALPEASEEELLPATEPEEAQTEALELAAEEAVDEAIAAEAPIAPEEALPEPSEEEFLPATEPEEAQAEALELAAEEAVAEAIAPEETLAAEEALPEPTEDESLPAAEAEEEALPATEIAEKAEPEPEAVAADNSVAPTQPAPAKASRAAGGLEAAEADMIKQLDLPEMNIEEPGAPEDSYDDAEDEQEETFSLRTRSMAEVLAEQGDIQGALDIYQELAAAATSSDEAEDINRRIATLNARLHMASASAGFKAADAEETARGKEKLLNMLEALARNVEARAH